MPCQRTVKKGSNPELDPTLIPGGGGAGGRGRFPHNPGWGSSCLLGVKIYFKPAAYPLGSSFTKQHFTKQVKAYLVHRENAATAWTEQPQRKKDGS